MIVPSNTVVHPHAMMVFSSHAHPAEVAVFGASGFGELASTAGSRGVEDVVVGVDFEHAVDVGRGYAAGVGEHGEEEGDVRREDGGPSC